MSLLMLKLSSRHNVGLLSGITTTLLQAPIATTTIMNVRSLSGGGRVTNKNNNNNNKNRRNSWLNDHTNLDRHRHSKVNNTTGGVFFVITSLAAVSSVIIMGKS